MNRPPVASADSSEARRYRDDVTAVLELWTPPQESLDATIDTERRWAEDSVTYLKPLLER